MKIFSITILVFLTSLISFSQETITSADITPTEGEYNLNSKMRHGFQIIVEGESKDILKFIRNNFKDNYNLKMSSSRDKMQITDATNASFSEKQFSLYVRTFNSSEKRQTLTFWMSLGEDIYVDSQNYQLEYRNLYSHFQKALKLYYSSLVDDEIKIQDKAVSSISKTYGKELKKRGKADKRLASSKKEIESLKDDQVKLKEKIKSLEGELANSEKTLSEEQRNAEALAKEFESQQNEVKQLELKKTEEEEKMKKLELRKNSILILQ